MSLFLRDQQRTEDHVPPAAAPAPAVQAAASVRALFPVFTILRGEEELTGDSRRQAPLGHFSGGKTLGIRDQQFR